MNRPLRIAHIIGNLERGGAQAMLLDMMRRLDRDRFDPFLIHLKDPNDFAAEVHGKLWECHKVRATRSYRFGELRHLALRLTELRPDVVHTHADFANFAGRAAAIHARVPWVVVHYQNTYEHRFGPAFRRMEEDLAARTDAYIACSEGVSDFLARKLDLKGRPVELLPNAIDLEPFRSEAERRAENRRRFLIPDGAFHILHTARLEPHKQPGQLIRALRLAPPPGEWRLTLVGGGSLAEKLERELHQEDDAAAARGEGRLAPWVHFAGWSGEIPAWMSTADVFCLVSKNEGLPLSLVEAMAAGVPTVASDIIGPQEVLDRSRYGALVDSSHPEQIAAAIRRYREDDAFRRETIEKGRQRAVEYSVERYIPRLEDFYDRLTAKPGLSERRPAGFLERHLIFQRLRLASKSNRRARPEAGGKR